VGFRPVDGEFREGCRFDDPCQRVHERQVRLAVLGTFLSTGLLGMSHAAASPDGQRVVTVSDDKTARVWDTLTGLPRDARIVAALAEVVGGYTVAADAVLQST
jgi:hypothetical protein